MYILQINKRKGHKFLMSGLMFGFCMARIVTLSLRIGWAAHPENIQLAIAAMIFVSMGVLLLFIINLIFAQRILRAAQPKLGWNKGFRMVFKVLYGLIIAMLAMVITATVQSFYTLDRDIRSIDHKLQQTAGTYLLFMAFLPIPLTILGIIAPRNVRIEKFGSGRWRSKVIILMASAALLTLGAGFRTGVNFMNPRPKSNPAWYQSKFCFYFFNFIVETIVIYLYLVLRVDMRFWIPNASKAPGDYRVKNKNGEIDEPRPNTAGSDGRILSEEEVFDDEQPKTARAEDLEKGKSDDDYCNCEDEYHEHQ